MGFNKISELREILAHVPRGVLKPTERLILYTINSYAQDTASPSLCYIGYQRLSDEVGISHRAVQDNLHRLGNGKFNRKSCLKPGCEHLNIVQRHVRFARKGSQQNYSINWTALWALSSVNPASHLDATSVNPSDVECEDFDTIVGTVLPTNRDHRFNKQSLNDQYLNLIERLVPTNKRRLLNRKVLSVLLDEWGAKNLPRSSLVEKLEHEVRDWSKIQHPQRFVEKKFREWIDEYTPTPTPPPYFAENFNSSFRMPE